MSRNIPVDGRSVPVGGRSVITSLSTAVSSNFDDKSNWTELNDGFVLTNDRVYTGSYSAAHGADFNNALTSDLYNSHHGAINNTTDSDSPSEATITSHRWIDGRGNQDNSGGYYFRYQNSNNCYVTGFGLNMNEFWVVKRDAGNYSTVGTADFSAPTKQWIKHKVTMQTDGSGNLEFVLDINDGSTTATVTDTTPSHSAGGGLGFGLSNDDGNTVNGNTAVMLCFTDAINFSY